jgi:hypothetical protein
MCILKILFITIISVLSILTQSEAMIDPESVVGIWLFDEGAGNEAKDSSGNGRHGEVKGNLKWIQGKFSEALEFPGVSGSFVRIPHNDSFNVENFTIVTWLQAENTGARQEIMMKRAQGGVNSQNIHLQIESGRNVVDVGFTADNQWATGLFGQTDVTTGDWYHIAATYDGEMLRLYVNGIPDGQQPRSTIPDNNDASLTIGAVFENGTTPLKGVLDDVGLFNVALEEDDIVDIMEKGLKEVLGAKAVDAKDKLAIFWGVVKSG